MKKLDVHFTRSPDESLLVGTLAEDRGRAYFQYAPGFLATGLNLSPFRLPFELDLFAYILDDAVIEWALTPAYDLLYTPGPGGEHTMSLAGEGRNPGLPHILRLAEQADVSRREANEIIEEVRDTVTHWEKFALQAGVSKAGIRRIAQSLPQLP